MNQMFLFLQSSFALRPTQVTYLRTLPASQMRLSLCLSVWQLALFCLVIGSFWGFLCWVKPKAPCALGSCPAVLFPAFKVNALF